MSYLGLLRNKARQLGTAAGSQLLGALPPAPAQSCHTRGRTYDGVATIDTESFPFKFWRSERLKGETIALDTETELIDGHQIPALAMATASDGREHVIVHPRDLARFLRLHHEQDFVCHHAAFDFNVIAQHLGTERDSTRDAWYSVVDEGRLHCTMLLDQLIRLAEADTHPRNRDLGQVAQDYVGMKVDKSDPYRLRYAETIGADWSSLDPGFFQYAIKDAIVTHRIYDRMIERATRLARLNGVEPGLIDRYGLLTEPLQVRAHIALDAITRRGLRLDLNQVAQTRQQLNEEMSRMTALLQAIPETGELFKRKRRSGGMQVTASGKPSINQHRLMNILTDIAVRQQLDVPRTEKSGQPTRSTKFWKQHCHTSPFLQYWIGLEDTAKLLSYLSLLQTDRIHPRYSTLVRTGRTACSGPNIQQLPKRTGFREMVVASPGTYLFIIDYAAVELRTLAAICLHRYGSSQLAEVLQAGQDPHAYTAALFRNQSLSEFNELKQHAPDQFKRLRQQAKALNFGIPGGLGAESLVSYAAATYNVVLSVDEANEFRERLIHKVYPELAQYLREDRFGILARNLRCPVDAVRNVFRTEGFVGAAAKVIRGATTTASGSNYSPGFIEQTWQQLLRLNQNPDLHAALEQHDVRAATGLHASLFWGPVVTETGRVRGRVPFTAARNTPFQGLAADGAKLALWQLHRSGYRTVAFVHDEVVVELPIEADHTEEARRINQILCQSMQSVTGTVPIECEFALAERWYHQAEATYDGDRLVPWQPPITPTLPQGSCGIE